MPTDPGLLLFEAKAAAHGMFPCRMANSSYDWLFAKPALRWLFNDYMDGQARALVRIRSASSQPGSHRLLISAPRFSWHALQHSAP